MDILDTAEIPPGFPDYLIEHARRYRATNGKDGHLSVGPHVHPKLQNIPSLLLVTRGRNSGKHWLTPLYYGIDDLGMDGRRYVLIASKAGAKVHPGWYKNILTDPNVRIQVGDQRMDALAAIERGAERARLWNLMEGVFPIYARYRTSAAPREIPVVTLTPK